MSIETAATALNSLSVARSKATRSEHRNNSSCIALLSAALCTCTELQMARFWLGANSAATPLKITKPFFSHPWGSADAIPVRRRPIVFPDRQTPNAPRAHTHMRSRDPFFMLLSVIFISASPADSINNLVRRLYSFLTTLCDSAQSANPPRQQTKK
jgi:hypothetical protein